MNANSGPHPGRRNKDVAMTKEALRHRMLLSLAVLAAIGWSGPSQARDYMSDARGLLAKGDLRGAQVQLRNAVRDNPDNGEALFELGAVDMQLGDPVAAEREVEAARDRGFDPGRVMPLLIQTYLAQGRFADLLHDFPSPSGPTAGTPELQSQVLVGRGIAEAAQGHIPEAQADFGQAERLTPNAIEPVLAQARLALSRGDLATAQDRIDRALAIDPKSNEALLRRAQLLRARGDNAGAVTALDELLTRLPNFLVAKRERAAALIALGQDDRARADLAAVAAAYPNDVQVIYLQAVLQARAGDMKGADASLQRIAPAIASVPRGYFLVALVKLNLGDVAQAEEAAAKFTARNPTDLPGLKLLAAIQLQQRHPDQAIATLQGPAASPAADAQVFDLLGRAYSLAGQSDQALQAFQRAAAMAPTNPDELARLAQARLGRGDTNGGIDDLEKTLELAPTRPNIGPALFFAALGTGDLDRAAAELDRIRKAQGDTPAVQNMDGILRLSRLDLAGARAEFTAILHDHPDFTPAAINLARVAAIEAKPEEAARLLSDILARQPTSEPALTMYVGGMANSNHMADAIAAMQKAHDAAPKDLRLTISLSQLLIRSGDPGAAVALLEKARGDGPPSAQLFDAEAAAYVAQKQPDAARDAYRQAVAANPNDLDARRRLAALLVDQKDYAGARSLLADGLTQSPGNYLLMRDLVAVDLHAGDTAAALATADRLTAQAPANSAGQALKGDVLMSLNRPQDAVAAYADAMRTAPSGFLLLREAAAQSAAGHPDQSARLIADWLAKHPDDTEVALAAGSDAITAGHLDDAERLLAGVLQREPRNAVAMNNLAWLWQLKNDPRALPMAEKAYLLLPTPQSADTLGWILTRQGDAAKGVVLLREANARAATDPAVAYHYAVALKDAGQKAEAVKLLTLVVRSDAKFDERAAAEALLTNLSGG
jgi:putative PEP-CTERM system TPR-repeat lipoprotein